MICGCCRAPRVLFTNNHTICRYDLNSICDCAESCVRALLNESQMLDIDRVSEYELKRSPNYSACSVMLEVSSLAGKFFSLRYRSYSPSTY